MNRVQGGSAVAPRWKHFSYFSVDCPHPATIISSLREGLIQRGNPLSRSDNMMVAMGFKPWLEPGNPVRRGATPELVLERWFMESPTAHYRASGP